MRTVSREQHRRRRTHIIECAVVLLATKGFAATTTADICRAAGISTGALPPTSPPSRRSFAASGSWTGTTGTNRYDWDEMLAGVAAGQDRWAALRAVVDKLAAEAAEAAEPIMSGLVVEVAAQASRDPEVAAGLAASDRRQIAGVAEIVRRLQVRTDQR